MRKPVPAAVRFWSHVNKLGPQQPHMRTRCWEWTASLGTGGYGQFCPDGSKPVGAHRYAWSLKHGPLPAGESVLHRCDYRKCCRPSHLFLGSQAANVADAMSKGRLRHGFRTHRPAGEANVKAKLTEADVVEMRRRHAAGESVPALASEFGINRFSAWAVVTRRKWKHVA